MPDDDIGEEIVLPIEDFLDLHTFLPRDVRSVVESYLDAAREAAYSEVRIIHGKGIGVQREIVASVLRKHPAVSSFHGAGHERGGWGATVVKLKPPGR